MNYLIDFFAKTFSQVTPNQTLYGASPTPYDYNILAYIVGIVLFVGPLILISWRVFAVKKNSKDKK